MLTEVTPEMRAFREELFGPVGGGVSRQRCRRGRGAGEQHPYGLGGAVYTTDEELALAIADRLDTGMVWINQPEGGGAELPFGGTKRSGVGRELGPMGIDEFVNKKLIHTTPGDG